MQFHPTAVTGSGFLLSEALRGEGAVLRDDRGDRFVDEWPSGDVVARAIAERGRVGLDLRARSSEDRFSSLMATLERDGYDPRRRRSGLACRALLDRRDRHRHRWAHERAGAVRRRRSAAAPVSTVPTGSPRTRCSSASVFGRRAAHASLGEPERSRARGSAAAPEQSPARPSRSSCAARCGSNAGLIRSADELEPLRSAPLLLARLLAESALARQESRGAHFRCELPARRRGLRGHIVAAPRGETRVELWP